MPVGVWTGEIQPFAAGPETLMSLMLSGLPIWQLAIVPVIVPTTVAMPEPILIRQRVDLARLVTNNEIAGFKFAIFGVIYAVLLAFAVIVVWETFSDAEAAVFGNRS